jgi:Bifunctional DNA primase/polymerase, N-terminal
MTRPGWVLNPLLRGALVAAAAGLRVFPAHSPVAWPAPGTGDAGQDCSCQEEGCTAPGAHPRWLDWRAVATSDEDRLRAFWSDNPAANPAIVTGELADVLEVPAEAGERTAGRLARLATDLPIARSGSGTWQFYLRATGLPAISLAAASAGGPAAGWAAFLHGRDGWVLVPPARHVGGGAARWLRTPLTAPLAELSVAEVRQVAEPPDTGAGPDPRRSNDDNALRRVAALPMPSPLPEAH